MQPFAGRDLHTSVPDLDGWETDILDSSGKPGVSTPGRASVLLFISFLMIGTFATLLIVW
ncbi:hypothetical protein [Methanosphaerula palustris]|nr:hypothetical protein [Methanosphaerula palustris]